MISKTTGTTLGYEWEIVSPEPLNITLGRAPGSLKTISGPGPEKLRTYRLGIFFRPKTNQAERVALEVSVRESESQGSWFEGKDSESAPMPSAADVRLQWKGGRVEIGKPVKLLSIRSPAGRLEDYIFAVHRAR